MCIRVLQRNKTNRIETSLSLSLFSYLAIYLSKEQLEGIDSHDYGDWKAKICSVGSQGRDPGEPMVQMNFKDSLLEKILAWGSYSFSSNQTFNWLNEAHSHYGGQSDYFKFTNLMLILSRTPSKLTDKINHKSTPCQTNTINISLNHTYSPNKDNNKAILTPNMIQLPCVQPKHTNAFPKEGCKILGWCPSPWYLIT